MPLSVLRALGIAKSSIDAEPVDLVAGSACLLFAFLLEGKDLFHVKVTGESEDFDCHQSVADFRKCAALYSSWCL